MGGRVLGSLVEEVKNFALNPKVQGGLWRVSGLGNVLDLGLFFLKCLIMRHFKHTENNITDTSCLTTKIASSVAESCPTVKGNEDTAISSRVYCLIWPKFARPKCLEVGNEMCNRLNACVSPNFICQNPTLPNVIILGSGAFER